MHHTYVNNPGGGSMGSESTADIPDIDFLTDANVYYNLPPPPPRPHVAQGRSALSLPRGHLASQPHSSASWSCPSSPKLLPAVVPRRGGNFTPPRHHAVDKIGKGVVTSVGASARASTTSVSGDKASPCAAAAVAPGPPPPPIKERVPKPKNKKLAHTRSFDLDHLYQNLVRVASKPRSNSFSVPWRRKKKSEATAAAAAGIKEEEDNISSSPDRGETSICGVMNEYGSPPSRAGTHSSSSSTSSSDTGSDECVPEDCAAAEIYPGVTYVRETAFRNQEVTATTNSWYHSAATLPLRHSKAARDPLSTSGPAVVKGERRPFDVAASLEEWRRKERWLEKKRTSRHLRQTGESGEVHVVILYAEDGADWKNYLYELFTQMVPKEEGYQAVRVEVKNVEEIEDNIRGLQAIQLKEARLQIVVISPRFMAHIAGQGRSEIGQLFEPEKVLGLLLGVNDSQFSMAHLSALYSYKDWHRLKVRNLDLSFVEEVLSEAIKILNSNKLYVDCLDERAAKFKVTTRKVTMTQKQVYILLNDQITKPDVEVYIEAPGRNRTLVSTWHILNPYTIWFSMPEEFLKASSLLQVSLVVNQEEIGSRQLKCESNMDTLRDILASVSNPTELMCQALNINPISEDLDQKLAEKVRLHMPLTKIEEPISREGVAEFPTWIHFSAFYGLERLTWTLLEIPGAEEALTSLNCNGHTPSVLAYQKGFYSLAQKLEDAALVSSLATKVCYVSRSQRDCDNYNNPPPPRPLATGLSSSKVATYDTLPAPRMVDSSPARTPEGGGTPPDSLNTSPVPNRLLNEPKNAGDDQGLCSELPQSDNVCAIPVSPVNMRHNTKANEKLVDCYLDMNASTVDRQGKLNEYCEDVYALVEAWNEKTDIKVFVERNQDKIEEMKNKLENSQQHLDNGTEGRLTNEIALPAVPEDNRFSNDSLEQNTMVDKFISLLQDTYSEGDEDRSNCSCQSRNAIGLPSNDSNDKTSQTHSDKSPSPKCSFPPETSVNEKRPPVPPPRPTADPYLSHDQVNTPHQFEISVELKRVEDEKSRAGKSLCYPILPKATANIRSPNSVTPYLTESTSTTVLKNSEENNVDDELYTKLLND